MSKITIGMYELCWIYCVGNTERKKCEFGRDEIEFVEFVINDRGLRLMENKTREIKDRPRMTVDSWGLPVNTANSV